MFRNLTALGLALVAVLAFSAVTASAASAANGKLTSTGPVTLDGTEIGFNKLTAFGAEVECLGSALTGHKYNVTPHELVPSGAETITLTPDYNEVACRAVEGATLHKATITMNGCDYVVHIGETVEADTYNTRLDVVCPAFESIVVDVYFSSINENLKVCEVTIGSQSGIGGATLTNETNGYLRLRGAYNAVFVSKSGVCGASTGYGELDVDFTLSGTNTAGGNTSLSLSHE